MANKDLFVSPSLYSLFFYTLINEDWITSDYVLSDRIPKVIHDNLREKFNLDVYTYYGSKYMRSHIKRLIVFNREYFKFRKYARGRKYRNVYGNDEFPPSCPYREEGMYLVEDGSLNAETKSFYKKRRWRADVYRLNFWSYWLFNGYLPYGWSKYVKGIYHTPAIKLQPEISEKGIEIDLQTQWNSLTQDRKVDILKLFGIDEDMLNNINRYSIVLVTQILPIPDEDKIQIYKQMLQGLDESKVLIKTHYAESTDYSAAFPKSKVVTMPVPMQLFSILGYEPKKVMTISSGAVGPFIKEGVDVTFLGTECDPRIAERYGVITLETYMNKSK